MNLKVEQFINLHTGSWCQKLQNRVMLCNLTDILLIKDFSLNIDSRKQNKNSVFLCKKMGITSTSLQTENTI